MATTTHLRAVRDALSNFSTDAREFQFIVQNLEEKEFESVVEALKSRFDNKRGPAHVILAAHIFKRILSVATRTDFRTTARYALDEMNDILRVNGFSVVVRAPDGFTVVVREPDSVAANTPSPTEAETAASMGAALVGVVPRNPPAAEQGLHP